MITVLVGGWCCFSCAFGKNCDWKEDNTPFFKRFDFDVRCLLRSISTLKSWYRFYDDDLSYKIDVGKMARKDERAVAMVEFLQPTVETSPARQHDPFSTNNPEERAQFVSLFLPFDRSQPESNHGSH
jgi:hypothetical protein